MPACAYTIDQSLTALSLSLKGFNYKKKRGENRGEDFGHEAKAKSAFALPLRSQIEVVSIS